MKIQELAKITGVSTRTIRYYEETGLLPTPARAENNYRQYSEQDVERVRLVVGARRLGLSLDEISEVLTLSERRAAPCRALLERLEHKADEIAERIRELRRLESELRSLHALGRMLSLDDVDSKQCVCHLVSERTG
uniref:Heavy metal-responsive transcriptional regulator n=1 Tax=Caldilinea aerophila TaxID=133453 RepID=A0A7C1FV96_9CHLR